MMFSDCGLKNVFAILSGYMMPRHIGMIIDQYLARFTHTFG